MSLDTTIAAILSATSPKVLKPFAPSARFFLVTPEDADIRSLQANIETQLAPLHAAVQPLSASSLRDIVITIADRNFVEPVTGAFVAAHALEDILGIAPIEPEILHAVMPIDQLDDRRRLEAVEKFPPGCWVDDEADIENDRAWAVARVRLPDSWKLSEQMGRPSRGAGIVICQIDTGVTNHPELAGVVRAGSFNVIGDGSTPEDPTDPLNYQGNPGHGTGTASVAVSPETLDVVGAAPRAKHIPIRAIESVVRLSQLNVAEAIDRAVELGAHIISMSLGGIWSLALQRAMERAVTDAIVVAAAGNCVELVVWPARFKDCIAVAGTDYHDNPWIGSCRGPAVTISTSRLGNDRKIRPGSRNQLCSGTDCRCRRVLAGASWARDKALLRVDDLPTDRMLRLSVKAPEELLDHNVVVIGYPGGTTEAILRCRTACSTEHTT